MVLKISAVVITKNEESNIRECLETISWCDEMIVVDSNSLDRTVEFARQFTHKVFSVQFQDVAQKRIHSLTHTANEWVLFLDADERVTPELRREIETLNPAPGISGYEINRRNYYLGKWVRHGGLYPDYHLRLFRKDKAEVTNRLIHEAVKVTGASARLQNDMIHYSCKDINQMIRKIDYYSTHEAHEHLRNGKRISRAGVFTHAFSSFLRVFLSRKAFLDGIQGFFVSFNNSFTNFLTHLKLLKLQKRI